MPGVLRTRKAAVAGGLLAVLVVGGVIAYLVGRKPGDVRNGDNQPFTTAAAPKPKKVKPKNFTWPWYGYDLAHTKVLPGSDRVRPPFRRGWTYSQRALLEFPPSLDHGVLFQVRDDGVVVAINSRDGHVKWHRQLGTLAASTPAVGHHRLWVTMLRRGGGSSAGRVVCLSQRTGRVLWTKSLPSRTESSPLLLGRHIIFGSEDGTVYSRRWLDGKLAWTYHAAGAVKAALAYSRGNLYFGDYGGQFQAIRAKNGRPVWTTSSNGGFFGRSGTFYSTAAVAYGRVYAGNTDGRFYSFSQATGKLAWASRTSNYVYSSPAVLTVPGLGPTVYAGSYDGNFYAFDAKTGTTRWTFPAGGRISGGVFIIGDIVYFSDLGDREVIGLDPRSGKRRFVFHDGAFNPGIADRHTMYLVGYGSMYQLKPGRPGHGKRHFAPKRARKKR